MDGGGISFTGGSLVSDHSGNEQEGRTVGRPKKFWWNHEREARLRELCGQRLVSRVIAEMLSTEFDQPLSRKAVDAKALALGMDRRPALWWLPEHDAYVKELATDLRGFSLSIIADKLNLRFGTAYTRNSVIGRLNRMKTGRAPTRTVRPRAYTEKPGPKPGFKLQPRISASVVQLRCAEIVPRHLSLFELGRDDCRWPLGDGPFTFCGCLKMVGSSYCTGHHLLSVRSPMEAAA